MGTELKDPIYRATEGCRKRSPRPDFHLRKVILTIIGKESWGWQGQVMPWHWLRREMMEVPIKTAAADMEGKTSSPVGGMREV